MIREATERGEFDNLPGSGKPLNLNGLDDPDWWAKQKIADENLDSSALMPPVVQLRRERDGFPGSLLDVADESAVRAVLQDFNRRVKLDRLAPRLGPSASLVAQTVDVDDLVRRWRELRRR
nr:DUF1992 domain-containing protein [Williamsia sterculiae]